MVENISTITPVNIKLRLFTVASPKINEEAGANVSLHCRGTNSLIIKHTPGIYVIEQSVSVDTWGVTTVVNAFLRLLNIMYN